MRGRTLETNRGRVCGGRHSLFPHPLPCSAMTRVLWMRTVAAPSHRTYSPSRRPWNGNSGARPARRWRGNGTDPWRLWRQCRGPAPPYWALSNARTRWTRPRKLPLSMSWKCGMTGASPISVPMPLSGPRSTNRRSRPRACCCRWGCTRPPTACMSWTASPGTAAGCRSATIGPAGGLRGPEEEQ